MVIQIYKIRKKFGAPPSRENFGGPKETLATQQHQNFSAILDNFATWSSPERKKTSSNGKRRRKLR